MRFFASLPRPYVCEILPDGDYLFSVAPFWNGEKFSLPRRFPDRNWFIDSGAFSFRDGVPFSVEEYCRFVTLWKPEFVASIDVFKDAEKTVQRFRDDVQVFRTFSAPLVPVVTGTCLEEYIWCAKELMKIYPEAKMLAVGGIKRSHDVPAIVDALIPFCPNLHLLGCSVFQWKAVAKAGLGDSIRSFDSGSWNGRFGTGVTKFNAIMRQTGKPQRQVAIEHMLPDYRTRFERDLKSLQKFKELLRDSCE